MNKANYDRLMKVMTQLEPYGDYTEAEENQFDEDENEFVVATETGQYVLSNEGQHISRNNRRYRRNSSGSESESTLVNSEVTSRHGTERNSTFQTPYTESVATDENNQDEEPYTASTISEEEQAIHDEFQRERTPSTITMLGDCPEQSGPARPRAGWDSSAFASFGSLVAAANNTQLFPQAPKTARFYWMTATKRNHGRNGGIPDDEYLNRIEKVMQKRINSRQTSQELIEILSRRAELMPLNSDWAQQTQHVWKTKFPESSLYSDPGFQRSRDPNRNRLLPFDEFRPENIDYIRNRPMSDAIQFDRSQKPVAKQSKTTEHKWSKEDQERVLNQAHVTKAQQQIKDIRPDNQVTEAMIEFEKYVAEFWEKGEQWQKQPELAAYLARYKNVTEQGAFEQNILLCIQNKVNHTTTLRDKKS